MLHFARVFGLGVTAYKSDNQPDLIFLLAVSVCLCSSGIYKDKREIATTKPCCVFLQWQAISLTVIEKVQIAAAILGSLFLMASISWLVWSSFSPSARWQRQDLLFQICYGMYGFMDVVCIGEAFFT